MYYWKQCMIYATLCLPWGEVFRERPRPALANVELGSNSRRQRVGGISKDIFERRMATGSDSSSLLLSLDANKFVLLSVFTFVERICPKIWAEPPPKGEKISTFGYRPSLKRSLSVGYGLCFVKVFPLLKKQHFQIPIWSGGWDEYCYLLKTITIITIIISFDRSQKNRWNEKLYQNC